MKTEVVHVSYVQKDRSIPVGRLAYIGRKIFFEYDPSFLESGIQLSPFKLPLKPGAIACEDVVFDGLFGLFNDSLPDGWGRLLLDRKLMMRGIDTHTVTPLDRLRFVGSHGMGALQYRPEIEGPKEVEPILDLDTIAEACVEVEGQESNLMVDDLLMYSGSSAGARPKIMVRLFSEDRFVLPEDDPKKPHNDWLIKFRSSIDPKDIGSIEYAYHLMAVKAGLKVPEARLFTSKTCSGYFGVKRFDRHAHRFLHMHTVSGLLHADFRVPSLDYETILKVTKWLTKDAGECEKQFRQAVFNVFSHNRDDHAKNFSFLMDEQGVWRVSPAYDLTFSSGPNGEHCTTIMREGRNPGVQHLMRLAVVVDIKEKRASEIIEEVKEAVLNWSQFAKEAHVSNASRVRIQKALSIN